ncbi:40074_t:CDS:2, partial [Gigaspora margarita]
AYILYMDICTGSDHNLAAASFNMHGLISKITLAPNYKKQDRRVFEYGKANKENWKQYQEDLYNFLSKRSNGIIFAAKKNIPFKIVKGSQPDYNIKHKSKEKKERSILHTSTIQISKLHRKLTKMYKTSKFIDSRTLLELNQIILEANTKLDTQIQALSSTINKEWLDDLKGWWRVLFRYWGLEKERKKFKDIKMYTDLRCKMLQNDQRRMLRNLLDKPFRSIKLDCILENINSQSVLISDPTEVKHRTQQHFQTQYQNRNTTNEKITEDWKQIYAPKEEIKDE